MPPSTSALGASRWRRLLCAVAVGLFLSFVETSAASAEWYWHLVEAQPDVPNGGRANAIAVNPADDNLILVASETGGLFRSTDRGATWRHVDALPEYKTQSVAFLRANPDIAIATVEADYRVSNGGGIWRSADRGMTWTQVHNPPDPDRGVGGITVAAPERFSAREISVAPDSGAIYVATTFGVSISRDEGITWRLSDPFGTQDHRVISVLAQPDGLVIAAGPSGLRRSRNHAAVWNSPTTDIGPVWDLHALGGSPLRSSQVFVVDGGTRLWSSEDGGDTWSRVTSAPTGGGGCGGIAFIKAISHPIAGEAGLQFYLSNRCQTFALTPPPIAGTDRFDLAGSWTQLLTDHGDTRDLGFDPSGRPLLLATDGGLHKTTDGGSHWTFTGGGSGGYNALQITEVASQHVTASREIDLYYGTQDNDIRATLDSDPSWPASRCCEGFYFEMQHRIAADADSQVTYEACGTCHRWRARRRLSGEVSWQNAPGSVSAPKFVSKSSHVQAVDNSLSLVRGLAVTHNLGATWSQYVQFDEDVRALPKLSRADGFLPFLSRTVLYQAITTGWYWAGGFEINKLARTQDSWLTAPHVSYPLMNNFGGLGINPTMFAWYPVFAVDPKTPNHLIAPDIIEEMMKETWDGGDNWIDRPDLTALVTKNGLFRFTDQLFPHASTISFYNDDPKMVAIGTVQAGLFISMDRGATWTKVQNSERMTYVTSIAWLERFHAAISTYGRGLWNLVRIYRPPPWWHYCRACRSLPVRSAMRGPVRVDPLWDPVPEKLARSLVVLDGSIQGLEMLDGRLTTLYVSPRSQIVWRSKGDMPQLSIRTATRWRGIEGAYPTKGLRRGEQIVALAINATDQPIGIVAASRQIASAGVLPTIPARTELPYKKGRVGTHQSRVAGFPTISIIGAGASNRVSAAEPLVVKARSLRPGGVVTVKIDGLQVQRAQARKDGALLLRVTAPPQFGLHSITLFDENGRGITGMNFLVVHDDEPERE